MTRVTAFKQPLLPVVRFFCALCLTNETFLDRGKIACLKAIANAGANRVEVDIRHTGHQRPLVEKRLALEAALPKTPSAVILAIRSTSDTLIQTAHKPANVLQPFSPLS